MEESQTPESRGSHQTCGSYHCQKDGSGYKNPSHLYFKARYPELVSLPEGSTVK